MPRKTKPRTPGRPKRDAPDGAALLIQSARSVFAHDGFRKATLRQIARAAGVNHALVVHRFGSKEALWKTVIEQQVAYVAPYVAELAELQGRTEIPIRARLETALRELAKGVFGNPEGVMLFSSIGLERGEKLGFLVKQVLVPYHDALYPLLVEAEEAGAIRCQHLETLFVVVVMAVMMAVSHRNIFEYFGDGDDDGARLQDRVTQFLVVNFMAAQNAAHGANGGRPSSRRSKPGL